MIVYATHIFDGLEGWATHLMYMEPGGLRRGGPVADFPELGAPGAKLLRVMEAWLREEKRARKSRPAGTAAPGAKLADASPFASSKHMAYYR